MADAVVTRPNRGQWENVVPGHPELSASFASREEAIDEGRTVADQLGLHHEVRDDDGAQNSGESRRSDMTRAFDDRSS